MKASRIAIGFGVAWTIFFTAWVWFQLGPVLEATPARDVGGLGLTLRADTAAASLWILPVIAVLCGAFGIAAERDRSSHSPSFMALVCLILAMAASIFGQALIHAAFVECPDHQISRIALGLISASLILFGWRFAVEDHKASPSQSEDDATELSIPGLIGFILVLTGGASGFATITLPVDPMVQVSAIAILSGLLACGALAAAQHLRRASA